MTALSLTIIRSTSCDMTKSFSRLNGVLESSAIAHLTAGHACIKTLDSPDDLSSLLAGLSPREAITLGVPNGGDTKLTTRAAAHFDPACVARTNETFRYPDTPGFLPIDVDIDDTDVYKSINEVLDALEACSPWLCHVLRYARPSASSYVDGRGLRGVHVYVPVSRASDIPQLGKRLQIEQWAAGRGRIAISRSGALLVRQLSDALIYQPSRLMFEAAPILKDGIERAVPLDQAWVARIPRATAGRPPVYRNRDGYLDGQLLPPLKDVTLRRFDVAVKASRNRRRAEAKRIALAYHKSLAEASGREDGDLLGIQALRALDEQRLPQDWPIRFRNLDEIKTVRWILDNWEHAKGELCADPFDSLRQDLTPSQMSKAEAVSMDGRLGIWSHKLQLFLPFNEHVTGSDAHPLTLAAERLCGNIDDWPDSRDDKRNTLRNVVHALQLLLREANYALKYDICTQQVTTPETITPLRWLSWLTHVGCSNLKKDTVLDAVEAVANQTPVDPWLDSVNGLPIWDGVSRLDTLFKDVFQSDGGDAEQLTGQLFIAGLLARQILPGAPVPVVPVLISPVNGLGKSHFVRQVAHSLGFPPPVELEFDEPVKMSMKASTSPLAELGEMAGLGRRDKDEIKRWTTDGQDTYREPYMRRAVPHPRRFVLCGTANRWEFYSDESGERRFMPVFAREPPPSNWSVELPQIAAEAAKRFPAGSDAYFGLVVRATVAVRTYNEIAMRKGLGTMQSELDDYLPEIIESKGDVQKGYIKAIDIRRALDKNASRYIRNNEISRWMVMRGWRKEMHNGRIYYFSPDGPSFEPDIGIETEKKPEPVPPDPVYRTVADRFAEVDVLLTGSDLQQLGRDASLLCRALDKEVRKVPVTGRAWSEENAYPTAVLDQVWALSPVNPDNKHC